MNEQLAKTYIEVQRLVSQARLLVADNSDGEFPFPDMRAVDLAIRLVAPGPKACAVSASECHEITKAVIAAYDRDTFPIKARETLINLADQLEAAVAAGAPINELLTDQGADEMRSKLDAVALQLDATQADRTLPLVAQVEALRNDRDELRKDRLFITGRHRELETELTSVTSLCDKTQRDRDFFRTQAKERGDELREALSKVEELSTRCKRAAAELQTCTEQRDKALENNVPREVTRLTMKVKQLEAARKPSPKKPARVKAKAGARKKS
jgi:hypothetical protein